MRKRLLQAEIVEWKFTFIIALLISALCWMGFAVMGITPTQPSTAPLWYADLVPVLPNWVNLVGSFAIYLIVCYVLVQRNRVFAFVRSGVEIQSSIFLLLISVYPAIQTLFPGLFILLFVCFAAYILLYTYQHNNPQGYVFHVFFCLGLSALIYPSSVVLIPFFWIGMFMFNSWTFRSFIASILGLIFPYSLLLGHAYFYDQMALVTAPLQEMIMIYPIDWSLLTIPQLVMLAIGLLQYIGGSVYILMFSHHARIRVRTSLRFLTLVGAVLLLLIALQPIHCDVYLPLLLMFTTLMSGYVFVTTFNKVSNAVFVFMFAVMIIFYSYHIWMH